MYKTVFSFLVSSILFQSVAAAENLLSNGGFELPEIAPNSNSQFTLPLWWEGGSHTAVLNGTNVGFPTAIEGMQHTAISTSERISQAFTVEDSGEYVLEWFDASPFGATAVGTVPYSVQLRSLTTSDIVIDADFDALHTEQEWVQRTLEVPLNAGEYSLSFIRPGNLVGGFSSHFDAVSLSVPEPSTVLILSAGLASLAALRCRPRNLSPAPRSNYKARGSAT